MRKVLISLAAAGAALAIATPAAAQYYPGQYGVPYGNAYGYNNYGQVRSLQARIDRIEWQINRLDRRDRIRDRSANRLRDEANNIERRLRHAARDGMSPWEAQDIQVRIARLEQRVQYTMARGYGRYGYNNGYNGYGNNGGYYDRDRDGRDDRYENDRGYDHDD
jgi:hypothetical protein